MSAQQRQIQNRKKKLEDSSFDTSNSYDYDSQQSNENENLETIETYRSPPIHSLGKDELEDYVLEKLKTLGSHFPDNPELSNLVTMIKKSRRKEKLKQLDILAKKRRKRQDQQQQSPSVSYHLEYMNDIDSFEHIIHNSSKKNKSVRVQ